MKNFTFSVLVSALLLPSLLACELKVRVANIPPHYLPNETKGWSGLAVEQAEALLTLAGCKARFKVIPWKRALLSIQDGSIDMMMNMSKTPDRGDDFYFIGPHEIETVVILVMKKNNFNIKALDDLKSLPEKIGIEVGVHYGHEFTEKYREDKVFKHKFYQVPFYQQKVKMLRAGNVSAILDDQRTAEYQITHDEKFTDIKIHPFIINREPVYFGLSKKSVGLELLQRLESANKKALALGLYKKITEKYTLKRLETKR